MKKTFIIITIMGNLAFSQNKVTFDENLPIPKELTISTKKNKSNISSVISASQNYAAFWNTGDEKYIDKSLDKNFIDLNLPEGRPQGIEGPKIASKTFRQAVPNLSAEIEQMIISENKAIVQYQFKGNFTGNIHNKQGNGENVDFKAIDVYTIKDGKITHNWHLEDNLTLLLKMGIVSFNK